MISANLIRRGLGILLGGALCLGGVPALGGQAEGEEKSTAEEAASKKEKPKPQPFRYSAWCAFRNYNGLQLPVAKVEIEKQDQSRPGAGNWGGFSRHGKWITLVVELENTTDPEDKINFSGSMRIRLDPSQESTESGEKPYKSTYRQEFEVPPGPRKKYSFSVLCPEFLCTQISIEIIANGKTFQRSVSLTDLDEGGRLQDLIVVVSDKEGKFRGLMSSRKVNAEVERSSEPWRHVAVVRAEDLPNHWHDLLLANLVIIDEPPREGFTDEQIDALEGYVQAGGQLLVGGGNDPARLKPREGQRRGLADLAGLRVNGSAALSQLTLDMEPFKGPGTDWKLPIVDVTARPDAGKVFELKQPGTGLVERIQRKAGLGMITFLPFAMSGETLEAWPGRTQVPLGLLHNERSQALFTYEQPDESLVRNQSSLQRFIGEEEGAALKRESLAALRRNLDTSFSNDTPVETQTPSFVFSFLLVYLLAAVPGNYLIFGWFRRREVAWLAVPLWAGSFSVIAYVVGYMGKSGKLTINEVCVVEAGANQSGGIGRTFLGLYSPRYGSFNLHFQGEGQSSEALQAAPGHLIGELRTRGITTDLPELGVVEANGTLAVENLVVHARSIRRLEVNHRVDLGAGMEASFTRTLPGAGYRVRFRNGMPYQLLNATLVQCLDGQLWELPLGNLDASMSQPLVREVGAPGIPGGDWKGLKDADEVFFRGPPTFRNARGKDAGTRGLALLEYLRGRIENVRGKGDYHEPLLLAWIDGGVLPVGVEGEEPGVSRGMTLLVLPFPEEAGLEQGVLRPSRRILTSPDFDLLSETQDWRAVPAGGAAGRFAVRGEDEGVRTFRIALDSSVVRAQAGKKLVLTFNLTALTEEAVGGGQEVPAQYQGRLAVIVQSRRGENRNWDVRMKPAEVSFTLAKGTTRAFRLECPLSQAMIDQRALVLKVQVEKLKVTGKPAQMPSEWPLALEQFTASFGNEASRKAEQE